MLAPIRGGNWNNGSNAGVFALNLNNESGNSNINVGFRDSAHGSHSELLKVRTGRSLSGAQARNRSDAAFLVAKANVRRA